MKTGILFVSICVALVLAASFLSQESTTPRDEMMAMVDQMENALGEEWKKQSVTEVTQMDFSFKNGSIIHYYVCITTYYEGNPEDLDGLNISAIATVVDPMEAKHIRECTISNHPGAIYQKDGLAYLCWTILPEVSFVIEYDPDVWQEADMFQMAQSVPANQVKGKES